MCARCYLLVCCCLRFKIVKHVKITCIIVHHIIFLTWMTKMSHLRLHQEIFQMDECRLCFAQNGPTINEHATQRPSCYYGQSTTYMCPFGHTRRKEFPFDSFSLLHNLVMFFGSHYMCTVMMKHLPYPHPMNIIDVHHLLLPKLFKLNFLHNLHTIVGGFFEF